MPKCKIEFEGGNTFHAGQLLRGTVRLSLENRRIVRSVYILFRGKATAKWFQESHRNIRNRNHGNGYHRDRGNMFMRGFLPNRNRYVNDIIIRLRSSTEILLDDKQYLEKEFESIGPRGNVHADTMQFCAIINSFQMKIFRITISVILQVQFICHPENMTFHSNLCFHLIYRHLSEDHLVK